MRGSAFLLVLLSACAATPERSTVGPPTPVVDAEPPEGDADASPEAEPPLACADFPELEPIIRLELVEERPAGTTADVHRVVSVRGHSATEGFLAIRAGFRDLNGDRRSDDQLVFGRIDEDGRWAYRCDDHGACLQSWVLDCRDGRVAGPCQPSCTHEHTKAYMSLHRAQLTEDFNDSYPPALSLPDDVRSVVFERARQRRDASDA